MAFAPQPQSTYIRDTDGYVPPRLGGTLAVKMATVTFEDTEAFTAFVLPRGAVPVQWNFNVTTDFNDGTSNLLNVGLTGNTDAYIDDLNIGTLGNFTNAGVAATSDDAFLVETPVLASFTGGGDDATTGSGILICIYAVF